MIIDGMVKAILSIMKVSYRYILLGNLGDNIRQFSHISSTHITSNGNDRYNNQQLRFL